MEFFLNPPEGVAKRFRAPEIKNGLRFDFSNFFKNLYKIYLVKLIAMNDLIFWLELHYKKDTLQKTAKIWKKDADNIFLTYSNTI